MKRLKLNVDELLVESFEATERPGGQRGTVHGNAKATYGCTVGWDTCFTLEESCQGTCDVATGCHAMSQCVGWCESEHGCSAEGSCQMTQCFTCYDPTCELSCACN